MFIETFQSDAHAERRVFRPLPTRRSRRASSLLCHTHLYFDSPRRFKATLGTSVESSGRCRRDARRERRVFFATLTCTSIPQDVSKRRSVRASSLPAAADATLAPSVESSLPHSPVLRFPKTFQSDARYERRVFRPLPTRRSRRASSLLCHTHLYFDSPRCFKATLGTSVESSGRCRRAERHT